MARLHGAFDHHADQAVEPRAAASANAVESLIELYAERLNRIGSQADADRLQAEIERAAETSRRRSSSPMRAAPTFEGNSSRSASPRARGSVRQHRARAHRRGRAPVNVLLLHLDGRLPNVALMRLAAHHRALGDEVTLRHAPTMAAVEPEIGDNFDRLYASAIFERTRPLAERLLEVRPDAIVGGTGVDVARTLESIGVTTLAQDYSVYPRCRFSIGLHSAGVPAALRLLRRARQRGRGAGGTDHRGHLARGRAPPRDRAARQRFLRRAELAGADRGAEGGPLQGLLQPGHQRADDLRGGRGGAGQRRLPGRLRSRSAGSTPRGTAARTRRPCSAGWIALLPRE